MVAIAVHGGAGQIDPTALTSDKRTHYVEALRAALAAGLAVLEQGGSSLDGVEAAVIALETTPLFNAGIGSVLNSEGLVELDAAIMCGASLRAGAIAGVQTCRHPVRGARYILDHSEHVMLAGKGADTYLKKHGLPQVPNSDFITPARREQWEHAQATGQVTMDHNNDSKWGTVGAVAVDRDLKLAAATSTGGMTNKQFGRVGDSPLIGAGTYANQHAAVSCTGQGEYFMRLVTAHSVCTPSQAVDLAQGSQDAIDACTNLGGKGGLITVNQQGEIHMPFNTNAMFRGCAGDAQATRVAIWDEWL